MADQKPDQAAPPPSAGFFHKLASAIPGTLFVYWLSADARTHCYHYISDQVRERFGLDPQALKESADAVFNIVHPEDAGALQEKTLESARTLQPFQFQARLRLRDGSYQWFEAESRPERQPDGSTVWHGQFHNIQQYKDLEHQLRERQSEFAFQAGFQKLVARLSTEFINLGFGTIDECIDHLLESVGYFFEMDRVYLYAFNDDYTTVTKTHQWCRTGVASLVDREQTVSVDAYDCWRDQLTRMVHENRVVFIETVRETPPGAGTVQSKAQPDETASVFCVPVRVQSRVVGFLGLDFLATREWRGDQADLLIIISGLLSGALERHLLEEKLLNQSIRDAMTGLLNRRYLMPRLHELMERADRYGENFTIAMLDIDHFKKINDSVGHLGGDYTLRRFAEILSHLLRATDVVARFGGEEFMVIFPNTEPEDARPMVNRILEAVRQAAFMFERQKIPVTVSAGVASVTESGVTASSVDALIGRADHRLYEAKQAGRDCAVDVSGVLRI